MNPEVKDALVLAPQRTLSDHVVRAQRAFVAAATDEPSGVEVEHEGVIERAADGLLHIRGLENVGFGELVQVGGDRALVMDLTTQHAVAALLADSSAESRVAVGQRVRQADEQLSVRVDDGVLGRVLDPLGNALDGRGLLHSGRPMLLERPAPQVYERAHVRTPLHTGTLAIDAMFPIGRGQRELIAGDEGTGRTALAVDAIENQARHDVICIYVGIGQRRAETWRIYERLSQSGAKFVIVTASEDTSPALRYLAPYAATAIGEYFRDGGRHALIVYDDLSAHAIAWRELSLLLGRPPGREAYPGDVFYLHSRLLERSAQLADNLGGGSLTALPICTLESGRITAYIPTNLVSISDGQLVMSAALFAAGHRPAIDAGLSVSRVGARAQSKLLASLSAQLKLDYAAFIELESFARLGTRLEPAAQHQLEVGNRVRALMQGPQGAPLSSLQQLVRLSMTRQEDALVRLDPALVRRVASQIATSILDQHPSIDDEIESESITVHQLNGLVQTELEAHLNA